jgi:O-antigen/teichoic acid export membrane protein
MDLRLIFKNSIALLGAELFSKILNLLFFASLARFLPPADIGMYISLITFISFGLFVSDPGLSQTLIRNISRSPASCFTELGHSLIISSCLFLFAWAGIFAAGSILNYPGTLQHLLLIGGIYLGFQSWAQIASSYIKALQRMEIIALGNSVGLALFSCAGIFAVFHGAGLKELTVLLILQSIFHFLFFWGAALRLGLSFPYLRWRSDEASKFIKEVMPMAFLIGSGIALNYLGIAMLSKMKGMSETATYGLAVKIIDNLSLFSNSVLAALFPFFSSKWERSDPRVLKALEYALKFFFVIGLVAGTVITLFSGKIITLFYGQQYMGSAYALVILIWSFFFYALGAPMGIIILIDKKMIVRFIPYAIGVVVLNVLLNLLLIPSYSYIGAAMSALICSSLLYFFKVRFIKTFLPMRRFFLKTVAKPLLASAFMGVVFFLTRNQAMFISLLLGGSSFVGALFILGEFNGEEYSYLDLKQVFQRWK